MHLSRCLIALLLTLLLGHFVHAQVEVNIKLKAESQATRLQFQSLAQQFPGEIPAMRSQEPYLAGLRRVQAISTDMRKSHPLKSQIFTLTYQSQDLASQMAALQASGLFEWVEPNRSHSLHTDAPNDPEIGQQWFHERIGTFAAWDITRGSSQVVVGILDTGLDYDHPEFVGQIAINSAEDRNGNGRFEPWPDSVLQGGVSGDLDGIDADGNGYIDDVIGYDFTDQPRSPFGGDYLFQDPDPLDDNAHGTLVAGIIAARADNQLGGAGIAPGCKVMPLRAFAASGGGEDDDIARAIIYAADNGVQVLNFSFGDIYPSQIMHEAIRYAYQKGVVMIGSAGNGTGDEIHYPSGFDEVISVAATDLNSLGNDYLWPLSSFGLTVDLAAPGSGIYTTTLRDTTDWFGTYSGTSTSAPMVSAAAALLISQRGTLAPEQVRGILTSSADDVSPAGWDHYTGAGRLNIPVALATVGGSQVKILSPGNDAGTAADSLIIVGTILHPEFVSWNLEWQLGTFGANAWEPILTNQNTQYLAETLAVWDIQNLADGEYTLRLSALRSNGSTAEDRIRLVVDRSAPVVEIRVADMAWDNDIQKYFLVFRSSDIGQHQLHFRQNNGAWRILTADRTTRNGEFLLGNECLQSGNLEYFISTTNLSGLQTSTPVQTAFYQPFLAQTDTYAETGAEIPMGAYLPSSYDWDGDGLREVVMSEYNENLGFGPLSIHEFNGGVFTKTYTVNQKSILIPKDVQDADQDGLLELLCSVNDSIYILEAPTANAFPTQTQFTQFGRQRYAARWADTDQDGAWELLTKDFKDYYISERSGNTYVETDTLKDITPDYDGSIAPRVEVMDNDGDGNPEIIFGDFDGDLVVYEWDGSAYSLQFQDTTDLQKGGAYIVPVRQNGFQGVFSAVHSNFLRNNDFEYDPGYWMIRLIGINSPGGNYTVSSPIYLYDVDLEAYNAATASDLDNDGNDEVIFTTFPRTYIFDFDFIGQVSWFHYGDICTDHVVADFNGNGIPEFALGRGDKALFYENTGAVNPLSTPAILEGTVLGPTIARLDWESPTGTSNTYYRIWKGPIHGQSNIQINLIDSVATGINTYTDTTLAPGQAYLYVVQRRETGIPLVGPFSNFVVLSGHALGQIDSAKALTETQVEIHFSVPIGQDGLQMSKVLLDNQYFPITHIPANDPAYSWVLTFPTPFTPGSHTLSVDSTFLDEGFAPLAPAGRSTTFNWNPVQEDRSFLIRWNADQDKEAVLQFNYPMDASVLDLSHYAVEPYGTIESIQREGSAGDAVRLRMADVRFGALGYPISIVVTGVQAQNGAPINEEAGNVATFLSTGGDLNEVFVYPNPVRPNEIFEGLRFAQLPPQAEIRVFSVSGLHIRNLTESNGDGGLTWDMTDNRGQRIRPGKYLFYVTTPEGETFVGKFAVLDE